MNFSLHLTVTALCCLVVVFGGLPFSSDAQLDPSFYKTSCPNVHSIVREVLRNVSKTDPRILASLIRLYFHDCFVQLLRCTQDLRIVTGNKVWLKYILLFYYYHGSDIKSLVILKKVQLFICWNFLLMETCLSDICAQGPDWKVPLGRRDSLTANQSLANANLPGPASNITTLKSFFSRQGLNTTDLVALSGAHTIGRGQCKFFVNRLYNFSSTGNPDPTLNTTYLQTLQSLCPNGGPGTTLADLDLTTPDTFDSKYYSNLQVQKGLFQSDQELFSTTGSDTIAIVNSFNNNQTLFFQNFKASMIKMGNIGVLTGSQGEIRKQCNFVNGASAGLDSVVTRQSSQEGVSSY
ncbi:hypothetical protein RYX36_001984 [Vicia faba]